MDNVIHIDMTMPVGAPAEFVEMRFRRMMRYIAKARIVGSPLNVIEKTELNNDGSVSIERFRTGGVPCRIKGTDEDEPQPIKRTEWLSEYAADRADFHDGEVE